MGPDNPISNSDNILDDTPIIGDESDKLLNDPPQNSSGSVSEDELENLLNNPPQNGTGTISEDEPDRLLSIQEPPLNRDRVVNVNVPPLVSKIELSLNLKDPSPNAANGPNHPSNYKIEINNLFKKPPPTDLSSSEDEWEEDQSIDDRLLKAAMSGNFSEVRDMVVHDPEILLGTTSQGSTCLHISSLFGHQKFFEEVVALNQSLLSEVNSYKETPLIVAVKNGHVSLAYAMLEQYRHLELKELILIPDNNGDNVLHHAIRDGHHDLALNLIAAEPNLSQGVNKYNESPLYIAVSRGFSDVLESLLKIPHCSYSAGLYKENALHAAVRLGDRG